MTDMILQTENLKKSFGKLEVLKGISTGIRRGEVVCTVENGRLLETFQALLNEELARRSREAGGNDCP